MELSYWVEIFRNLMIVKLEFYTEISLDMFHSLQPADLNFPPMSPLDLKHIGWSPFYSIISGQISIISGQISSPIFWLVNYTSIRSITNQRLASFNFTFIYTLDQSEWSTEYWRSVLLIFNLRLHGSMHVHLSRSV